MATSFNTKSEVEGKKEVGLNMLLPKIVLAFVLTVFFITQLELYFSSSRTLSELGYTYSRYTNEVFAQLSVVAAIVIGVLYTELEKKKINNLLSLVLWLQGVFLTFMAYKSVYEYVDMWGLTYKRLYGFAGATWILGVFVIYLYTHTKKKGRHLFLLRSLLFSGAVLVLINLANFDFLIYNFRKSTTPSGVDYKYLSLLSPDSLSYDKQLAMLTNNYSQKPTAQQTQKASDNGIWVLLYKTEKLQNKYQNLDIRGFNLMEYLQYQQIKGIDVGQIEAAYKLPSHQLQY